MAAYPYFLQQPEAPIMERWLWQADNIVADDGTEQRISLTSLPKCTYSGSILFTDSASLRQHLATMFHRLRNSFEWPAWHWHVKNKAAIVGGALTVFCNTRRSDFRPGKKMIIIEGTVAESRTINAVFGDRITLMGALANAYSPRAVVMPLLEVYSAADATVTRQASNAAGTGSFSYTEKLPLDPFIPEDDKVELDQFDGLPVLNKRPIGNEFQQTLLTGADATDYGALAYIRSRWLEPRWSYAFKYQSQRLFEPEDWYFWRTFAEYCRGSTNPFYVPQFRDDLAVKTPAAAGATQVILEGTEYSQNFWPYSQFHKIVFFNEAGEQHFASVTSVNAILGEDRLDFTPALPAGDWAGQTIGFLVKCRIADDTIAITHGGTVSTLTINLRTVLE